MDSTENKPPEDSILCKTHLPHAICMALAGTFAEMSAIHVYIIPSHPLLHTVRSSRPLSVVSRFFSLSVARFFRIISPAIEASDRESRVKICSVLLFAKFCFTMFNARCDQSCEGPEYAFSFRMSAAREARQRLICKFHSNFISR